VTWATSVPILVFLSLSVLELGPTYATDVRQDRQQTDVRQKHSLMLQPYGGGGIITIFRPIIFKDGNEEIECSVRNPKDESGTKSCVAGDVKPCC